MPTFTVQDDGAGNLKNNSITYGQINYTNGEITLNPVPNLAAGAYFSGTSWISGALNIQFPSGQLFLNYSVAGASTTSKTKTFSLPPIQFTFGAVTIGDSLVPKSLRFRWGSGMEYRDVAGLGTIYRHATPWPAGAVGTYAGTVNYQNRTVSLTDYVVAAVGDITVLSCLTEYGQWPTTYCYARTPSSPVSNGTFYVHCTTQDGRNIDGQSDQSGVIDAAEIQGIVNQEMGVFALSFGAVVLNSSLSASDKSEPWYDVANVDGTGHIWRPTYVLTDTLRMNCVVINTIPLSPVELGLDPVRLPSTGKVPIFKTGSRIVIHDTQSFNLSNPAVGGSTINCGRTGIARVRLEDAQGRRVPDDRLFPGQYVQYSSLSSGQQAAFNWYDIRADGTVWLASSMNLDTGMVELVSPLDLNGYIQPLKLYHTKEDSALVTSVDLSGYITINKALDNSYTAANSYVSSQLFYGDMWARYTNLFAQNTWDGTWDDTLRGATSPAQYNDVLFPLLVTNDGIIQERWRLVFTTTTAFSVYGERSGLIAVGDINTDLAPLNPVTNNPYFFLDHRGWGSGWLSGNVVRFNTLWAGSFWVARCVSPGVAVGSADTIGVAFRGDSDPA